MTTLKLKFTFALFMSILIISLSACNSKENFKQSGQESTLETEEAGNQDTQVMTPNESAKDKSDLPYTPAIYQTLVKEYLVNEDLSNIENKERFESLSDEQKKCLSDNAFFISPTDYDQLFYIYEENATSNIPNLITTDSVIQAYDLLLKYSQQKIEMDSLTVTVEDLTESMLNKFIYLYHNINNPVIKNCILKNIAYFGTAQLALLRNLPSNMPDEAKSLAEKEYSLIQNGSGYKDSNIFPYEIDYELFKPEGHYASGDFSRYFKAMTWYSEASFPIYLDIYEEERDEEQTLQALLIAYALFMDKDDVDPSKWERLYEASSLFNGKSDYLSVNEYRDLILDIYGENFDIESLNDSKKLDQFYEIAQNFREPNVIPEDLPPDCPSGKQFRFIGRGTMPDSEVFLQLTDLTRHAEPGGLDMMSVLGSDRAYGICMEDNTWSDYPKVMDSLKTLYLNKSDTLWRSNIYYNWLWTLKPFLRNNGSGYPSFMNNEAWTDKSLNTALCSWAMLHYDGTLNMGSDIEDADQRTDTPGTQKNLGYVEPSIDVYGRLQWLIRYLKINFESEGMLDNKLNSLMTDFDDLLGFLTDCSVKELRNEQLTDEEYMKISGFGDTLRNMICSLIGSEPAKGGGASESCIKSMETVSHISGSSFEGSYLEAGLGPAGEIYAVVPIGGKLYLTRGAVLSYYELFSKSGYRLSDGEWQDMIEKGNIEQPIRNTSPENIEADNIP